jgi:hypothetical protein
MKPRIRIIKHTDQEPKEPELDQIDEGSRQSTREISTTIKLWIDEFKERRRTDEQYSRNIYNGIPTALPIKQVFQVAGPVEGAGPVFESGWTWNQRGSGAGSPTHPNVVRRFEG